MPPNQPLVLDKSSTFCLKFPDTLSIEFSDSGFLFHSADGLFTPDLPTGLFLAKSEIGPFQPEQDHTQLTLGFFDFTKNKFFAEVITISSDCLVVNT